jgi:hypothetical protein
MGTHLILGDAEYRPRGVPEIAQQDARLAFPDVAGILIGI